MSRSVLSERTPLTLADLAGVGRWLRYSLIPFLALLIGAAVWAHDTNAAVKELKARQPVVDGVLHDLDTRTRVIDSKVDLLLEDRGIRGPTQ
jgi:hypothetical protein